MNIQPAKRIESVQEYYFSVKLKEIAQMNARGEGVINLGIGSPDLAPSKATIAALQQCAEEPKSNGYQSYVGIPELRQEFASWYKRIYDVSLDPSTQILPLMGSKEGIMHISMAFINEGDGVLVPNPGYPTYTSVSNLVGAKVFSYSLKAENDWFPDFEAIEAADRAGEIDLSKTKLMWCNYPNMPTGANGNRELFEALVAFGLKHNIVICHDNPYSMILNDNPLSILSVEGALDVCIELNSLSKSSNMAGFRVGMLATNKTFLDWVLRVKSNMDSGMYKPIQMAAVEALKAQKDWYDSINEVYMRRRILAREILVTLGLDVRENQVGMFLWAKLNDNQLAEGLDGIALCDTILYKSKVFLTPGAIFGSEGNAYVRISLCSDEATLEEALTRIKKL